MANTFLGGNNSLDPTIIPVKKYNYIKIAHGIFDSIFISNNLNEDLTDKKWGNDVLFYAKFQNNLFAGNLFEDINNITHIIVKRRRKDSPDHTWVDLFKIPITDTKSLKFEVFDKYVKANQGYEYALVLYNNTVSGSYNVNEITPTFEGFFVTGKDRIYKTIVEYQIPSRQMNTGGTIIPTIDNKYPYVLKNSRNQFSSGTAIGFFIEMDEENCEFKYDDSKQYRDDLLEFLTDGKAKFLKFGEGDIYLVGITGAPREDNEKNTQKYIITFEWAEVGHYDSGWQMQKEGLIDVDSNPRR